MMNYSPDFTFTEEESTAPFLPSWLVTALEAAQVGVWSFDPVKNRVIWNEQHERLLGYQPGTPDRSVEDFYSRLHPDDVERIRCTVGLALEAGTSFKEEFRVILPSGCAYWLQGKGHAVRDKDNRVVRLMGVLTNVNDRKMAEIGMKQGAERLKFALAASSMLSWDYVPSTGKVIFSSDSSVLYGASVTNIEEFIEIVHPEDKHAVVSVLKSMTKTDDSYRSEFRIIRRDNGETRWMEGRGSVESLDSAGDQHRHGVVFDITEKKQSEIEQRQNMSELQRLSSELARSNSELDRFASITSHDLKEPIRVITTYLQLIRRDLGSKLDPALDERIQFVVGGAKRMADLVDALLKFARVGSKRVQIEEFCCEELLKDVLENLRTSIEESQANILIGPMPKIRADRLQIGQVFQNLVSNALKFQRPTERAQIHITSTETDDNWQFSVRDNGIGIGPEHIADLFVIFHRVHSREVYPGDGIGLATCKKIVERHGGKISVESTVGIGTNFSFTIPKAQTNYINR